MCKRPWLGSVLMLALAGTALAIAQDSLEAVERTHRELVDQVRQVLKNPGVNRNDVDEIARLRLLIERARNLRVRSQERDYVYRSWKADYFYAWILCRGQNDADQEYGRLLFEKLLQTGELAPDIQEKARLEISSCRADTAHTEQTVSVTQPEQTVSVTDVQYRLAVTQKGGRAGGRPLKLFGLARMPDVSWEQVTRVEQSVRLSLGAAYRLVKARPFVIVGRRSEEYLHRIADRVLVPYYAYLSNRTGVVENGVIVAIVTSDAREIYRVSELLYGAPPEADDFTKDTLVAFSDPASRLMIAQCGKDPGNCTSFSHEIFHLLSGRSYSDAPWWIDEGIAELFESGELKENEFVARVGWRKPFLSVEDAGSDGLGRLFALSKAQVYAQSGLGAVEEMAQARYFCQFLHERHKMWPLYYAMRSRSWIEAARDPGGVELVSRLVLPLSELGIEYNGWVRTNIVPATVTPGP